MKIKLNYKMLFFILLFSFTMLLPVKALEEVDSSQSSDNTQTETEKENNQSENDIGSLTIELEKDGIKLENVNVFLYQVKYIEDYENLTLEYTDDFKEFNITEDLKNNIDKLLDYIESKEISHLKTISNEEGIVEFTNLSYGTYLVVFEELKTDTKIYSIKPFIFDIPNKVNKVDYYNLNAYPKISETLIIKEPEIVPEVLPDKLPVTGTIVYLVPILAFIGIILIILSFIMLKKDSLKNVLVYIIIGGGSLLILISFVIFISLSYQEEKIMAETEKVVPLIEDKILTNENTETIITVDSNKNLISTTNTININKKDYIGIIRIPSLNINLPVLSNWDETNTKLSPARYIGDSNTNPFIIAGHNNKNIFGRLYNIKLGDKVYFTDTYGITYEYEVKEKIYIDGKDVASMINTNYSLTLFTCSYDNQARLTIRCE